MGIDPAGAHFLAYCKAVGVDFTTTVTLGRQSWYASTAQVLAAVQPFDGKLTPLRAAALTRSAGSYQRSFESDRGVDPFLEYLGARSIDSIDYSAYEGATIVHDLNTPLPSELVGKFSAVLDLGTTEHVFDIARAMVSCMSMVAPGGYYLSAVPTNNQVGHGFYQVGPELFFRLLCPANGYEIRHVFLFRRGYRSRWYRLSDPAQVGRRITFSTLGESELFVLARRVSEAQLTEMPQQSDYVTAWNEVPLAELRRSPKHERRLASKWHTSGVRRQAFRWGGRARTLTGSLRFVDGVSRVRLEELAADSR